MHRDPSWELVRSFVRVVQAGSLTAAARETGASQPTLSRHIAQLEEHLGVRLFDRAPKGMQLTPEGHALWARAQQIGAQMDDFLRVATGLSEEIAGTVRVSVSESMSRFVLESWLPGFHREHPQVVIEWLADNQLADLLGREADLAVRMAPPQQLDLVARRVGERPLGFFAHQAYLARCGVQRAETYQAYDWVGEDRARQFLRTARSLGYSFTREDFVFRTDSILAQQDAVRAGVGVGVLSRYDAAQHAELVEIMDDVPLPALPVWVVARQEVHTNARVRLVFDTLANALTELLQAQRAALERGAAPPGRLR